MSMVRVLLPAIAVLAGCARIAGLDDVRVVGDAITADAAPDGPPCHGTVASPQNEGAAHMPDGSPVTWNANPPASGTHYDDWAVWDRTYSTPIPRGYWVHNLEHGGIVLLHNCSACAAEIDRLTAIRIGLPTDGMCAAPVQHRVLVTPDPDLPAGIKFAAIAWDFAWTATCVSEQEIGAFIVQHYGGGPEPTNCAAGAFP
jgi:hypothetical protein